jgi:hypothetical protein
MMAGELLGWLTQGGADWDAKQPTVRATGETVAYPPADVPDVEVEFEETFRVTEEEVNLVTNEVTLTWKSEAGFVYEVRASSDLVNWGAPLATVTATGVKTTWKGEDEGLGGVSGRRFYVVSVRRP